jgi:hypothetical protein
MHSIKMGVLTGVGLILYFLIMKFLGFEENFYLRIFNFLIVIAGVYFGIRHLFRSRQRVTYFEGITAGFKTSLTGVVTFVAFLAIYVSFIDPSFLRIMENSQIWGAHLNMYQSAFAVTVEGIASSAVISFAWMQYFKPYTKSSREVGVEAN